MRFWICGIAILVLVGCGETPQAKAQKRPGAKKQPKPMAEVATSAKIEVPPDAFASVPEALAAITEAQKTDDQKTILLSEEWIKLQGPAAAPILTETLRNTSAPRAERFAACRALSRLGAKGKEPLLEALESEDEMLRLKACEALALMKPPQKDVVAKMIELVDAPDDQMRLKALNSIRAIGPAAKEAEPKLLAILNSQKENDVLRAAASQALKSCAPRRTFSDP